MDFFHGQETLTSIQWILRAVIAFFFLALSAKVMGQRSIAQLRLLDFVIALIIGNIMAHPLSDEGLGLKGSMITMAVLISLYSAGVLISLKWHAFRIFLDPPAFPLITNGKISYRGLKKARLTIEDLLSELRKQQIEDPEKVAKALFESDGRISCFLKADHQTVTNLDLNLTPSPFDLPATIIREGSINKNELLRLGKNEEWLVSELKIVHQKKVNEILLGTLDQQGSLRVFLYS
ncbi:DUF421 domain-containing protein [Metabacillus idriensis]|uniref:DUF421 domain-containing protein n=1 Tax=Metabacillus idriensis TaxID=324768 RepID=A0A6I2M9D9_9BACI|nr:DUF421 domain-containing protein [Metabacillus idriensis]MCM3595533.1 DUF421 domain-containing protein [Metabacillus idriensis]MRX52443.1 DUF421 domain-containing protein [Metabacillus idriensis]OHR65180.1 hypothetical protein HMPREF3291_13055 [Bacillus sp. HMSC76G11]